MEPPSTEEKQSNFRPAPREEWSLISQGAEARVWKLSANDGSETWICKERFAKAYRHPELDKRLTNSRCRSEGKILEKCTTKSDIRVPKVVRVSAPLLYLEYLDCPTVKAYLKGSSIAEADLMLLAETIGIMIAKLHNLGVIHGDLTTSNMMVLSSDKPEASSKYELALIDFGLSKSSQSVEEKAVDLYVLERAFQSTHPHIPDDFFDAVLKGYSSTATQSTEKKCQTTLQRLEQVRARGRKRECFG
jgi:TP53 regulating kinase-like protein